MEALPGQPKTRIAYCRSHFDTDTKVHTKREVGKAQSYLNEGLWCAKEAGILSTNICWIK